MLKAKGKQRPHHQRPFPPPELEFRQIKVTTRETPLRDRIKTTRQRGVRPRAAHPTERDRNRPPDTSPGLAQIGFDGDDRGGVFLSAASIR